MSAEVRDQDEDNGVEGDQDRPLSRQPSVERSDRADSDQETAASDGDESCLEEIHALRRRLEEEKALRMREEYETTILSERVRHIGLSRDVAEPRSGSPGHHKRPGSERHDTRPEVATVTRSSKEDELPGSREKILEVVRQHLEHCNELDNELKRERAARWSALQVSMEADNSLEKTKKLEDALKKQARLEAQIADMEHRAWVADLSQIQMQAMQKRRDVHALQLLLQKEEARRRQLIREITSVQEMKERAMKYIGTRSNQFGSGSAAEAADADSD